MSAEIDALLVELAYCKQMKKSAARIAGIVAAIEHAGGVVVETTDAVMPIETTSLKRPRRA